MEKKYITPLSIDTPPEMARLIFTGFLFYNVPVKSSENTLYGRVIRGYEKKLGLEPNHYIYRFVDGNEVDPNVAIGKTKKPIEIQVSKDANESAKKTKRFANKLTEDLHHFIDFSEEEKKT